MFYVIQRYTNKLEFLGCSEIMNVIYVKGVVRTWLNKARPCVHSSFVKPFHQKVLVGEVHNYLEYSLTLRDSPMRASFDQRKYGLHPHFV